MQMDDFDYFCHLANSPLHEARQNNEARSSVMQIRVPPTILTSRSSSPTMMVPNETLIDPFALISSACFAEGFHPRSNSLFPPGSHVTHNGMPSTTLSQNSLSPNDDQGVIFNFRENLQNRRRSTVKSGFLTPGPWGRSSSMRERRRSSKCNFYGDNLKLLHRSSVSVSPKAQRYSISGPSPMVQLHYASSKALKNVGISLSSTKPESNKRYQRRGTHTGNFGIQDKSPQGWNSRNIRASSEALCSIPSPVEEDLFCRVRNFDINERGQLICKEDGVRTLSNTSLTSVQSVHSVSGVPGVTVCLSTSALDVEDTPLPMYSKHDFTTRSTGHIEYRGVMEISCYSVQILGANGVGKSTLLRQFMTSTFLGANAEDEEVTNDSDSKTLNKKESISDASTDISNKTLSSEETDLKGTRFVSLRVKDEEYTLQFIDTPTIRESAYGNVSLGVILEENVNAYVILYSIDDYGSFLFATQVLKDLLGEAKRCTVLFLVGCKSDLERCREVKKDEGHQVAKRYDCHFMEVSVALNHKVNELLVTIAKSIRAKLTKLERTRNHIEPPRGNSLRLKNVTGKLSHFFKRRFFTKSCDNLTCKYCE